MKKEKTQKELLESRLAKIEKELEGNRASVIDDGWQTQRFAKKSRKWDVLAQEKMKIKGMIEDIENQEREEAEAKAFYCRACLAMHVEECVCE